MISQRLFPKLLLIFLLMGVVLILAFLYFTDFQMMPLTIQKIFNKSAPTLNAEQYPVHRNISTTVFWVGETASGSNDFISNTQSAWDENWKKHFGGEDNSKNRDGYFPAKFRPLENPFYFALPYNDLDDEGVRKSDAASLIPWSKEQNWNAEESMLKNRWIAITKNRKTAYAQWEDVGPFGEDDSKYVFGTKSPRSKTNKNAGLDVSPAVRDYLGLKDIDKTDWQFIEEKNVPAGPWRDIITTSQVNF